MAVRKLRIAHVTATFPPYYAGTGLVCYYNARELARRGHEVHVYTSATLESPDEETMHGFRVHRMWPLFKVGNAPLLPGILCLKAFDLLHLHHPFITGAELTWLVSIITRTPFVLTHHNDLIAVDFRKAIFEVYASISKPVIFEQAAKLIVVSHDHARSGAYADVFGKRKVDVVEVPNGIDPDVFTPRTRFRLHSMLGLPEEKKIVLFVGALDHAHHYRRVDVLMDAVRQIGDPGLHLALAGDGDLRKKLESYAVQTGMSRDVSFLGNIPHEQLPEIYSSADCVVLPSSLQESFGIVIIEAMACGTPVIASDIPGVRTVVADGVDGFLVNPGDVADLTEKIKKLMGFPDAQRRAMGAAGRCKVVENYTWELAVDRLEAIYYQVLLESASKTAINT